MSKRLLAIAITSGLGFLAACNPPASDQHLQEQAAQATETAKQQSKEALAPGPGGCGQRRAGGQ